MAGREAGTSARQIFDHSATDYGQQFAPGTRGYRISEGAVLHRLVPHLERLGQRPRVLEVGAGTGQSSKRVQDALRKFAVGVDIVTTEYNHTMIDQGRSLESDQAVVPMVQADAAHLPFTDNSGRGIFDAVYGSQVIHWINDIPAALSEASRVLRPGGMAIHAGSGIIDGLAGEHFTQNFAYRLFLNNVEQELIARSLWDGPQGAFAPENRDVNPFFHRYSVDGIEAMFQTAGFAEIEISQHRVPIDRAEMLLRMGPGATSMFIFGGEFARDISAEIRTEVVDIAREKALQERPELFDALDESPSGDDTILFVAKKP
jgi:ubiquinone/menaquinone biosynthesis C-methylase UbiE